MLDALKKELAGKEPGKNQLVALKAGAAKFLLKDAKGDVAGGLLAGVQGLHDNDEVYQSADAWMEIVKGLK